MGTAPSSRASDSYKPVPLVSCALILESPQGLPRLVLSDNEFFPSYRAPVVSQSPRLVHDYYIPLPRLVRYLIDGGALVSCIIVITQIIITSQDLISYHQIRLVWSFRWLPDNRCNWHQTSSNLFSSLRIYHFA